MITQNENRIRVRVKETGQVGSISAEKYNPIVFDKIEESITPTSTIRVSPTQGTIPSPTTPQTTDSGGILETLNKVGEFLGFGETAKVLAYQAFKLTPEYQDLNRLKTEGRISNEDFKNLTTSGVAPEKALASFGLVALNLVAPGVLGAGTKLGLKGATTALKAGEIGKVLATPTVRTAIAGGIGGGLEAVRKGEENIGGKAAMTAGVGALIPVGISGISKVIGETTKVLASLFSGAPKEAINYALENPGITFNSIQRAVANPKSLNQVVDVAEQAFSNINRKNTELFEKGLQKLTQKYPTIKISIKNAVDSFNNDISKIGVVKTKEGLNFAGSPLDESEERLITKVSNIVQGIKSATLQEANNLKRKISTFYSTTRSRTYNAVISGLRKRIDESIVQQVPEMGQLNKKFADIADLASQIQKEFKVNRNSPRMVLNSLKRAFTENNELGFSLLKELEATGEKDVTQLLIGHYFKEYFPVGILGRVLSTMVFGASPIAAPVLGLAAPLASPRIVGTTATKIGQAQQALQFLKEKAGGLGGAGRTAIIDLLNKL